MATKTETIKDELINAVDNPSVLEEVIRSHSNSKGPLYIALAQATTLLSAKLKATAGKCKELEKEYQGRQQQSEMAKKKADDIEKVIETKNKEASALDEKLKDKKALLDQAKALGGLGFGPDKLNRLHNMLVQVATAQGAKPEEAVALFFQEVDRYEKIVSQLETKRAAISASQAKAEAERWQAEAKAAEARCKARKSSIDITEKLLAQGIKEADIPQWARILSKSGVVPEDLAEALEQFASIQKLCQDRQEQVKKLEKPVKELPGQVKALTEELESTSSQLSVLKKTKAKLEDDIKGLSLKAERLVTKVSGAEVESTRLDNEVKELQRQKVKLSSEVDGKQVSLFRLNAIGFLDEDLIRLKSILDRIAEDKGVSQKEVNDRFFSMLGAFKNVAELQDRQATESAILENLSKEKSLLTAEIEGLKREREILQGEIKEAASSVITEIIDTGKKTVLELQKQADDIKGRIDCLVAEALRVGGVVGEMQAMIRKGEESEKNLRDFIKEITDAGEINGQK